MKIHYVKKAAALCLLISLTIPALAQKGITFHVEDLSSPEKLLDMRHSGEVYKDLIISDACLSRYDIKNGGINVPFNIIAQSEMPDSLVTYGYHSFFNGMYAAYADHRPFVLSPDMIWLLITQGFAQHVNANPEVLRHHFVDFTRKTTLVVTSNDVSLSSSADKWMTIFPKFTKQLSDNTKGDIIDILSADFSTTTPVEKVASQITIMEAMKSYFEFVHINNICGIPEITLKGTPKDWQKVLNKTRQLSRYDLEWWTNELEPLLTEFVKASRGKIDKPFWRNMFKYHTSENYGTPKIIDGWIVKFFPYDSDGKRNNLQNVIKPITKDRLPEEIVKVDLMHIEIDANGNEVETPLELWAGFIGLDQDKETYALTPKIGWMIRKKDIDNDALRQKFEAQDNTLEGIHIRVKEVPAALLGLQYIRRLSIEFTDSIVIPDEMRNIKIDHLKLTGKISDEDIWKIKDMFPETGLIINDDIILITSGR